MIPSIVIKSTKTKGPTSCYIVTCKVMHGDADLYLENTTKFKDSEYQELIEFIRMLGLLCGSSALSHREMIDIVEKEMDGKVHRDIIHDLLLDNIGHDQKFEGSNDMACLEEIKVVYYDINGNKFECEIEWTK